MKFTRARILIVSIFTIIVLSGCELSLADDITPPPDYQRVSLERPTAGDVFALPKAPPNLSDGSVIFAQSCAACHGISGTGGGSQVANLPAEPPQIGSAELASEASPVDWFGIITLGNIDALMPPFEEDLSLQQRWDVLAYVYSLSDSEQLVTDVLPDGMQIAELPEQELDPPAVTPEASAPTEEIAPDDRSQQVEEPDIEFGTITGLVTHGGNDNLPVDLEINLLGLDGFEAAVSETTLANSDGSFLFEGIKLVEERIFFVSVDYQDMSYGSRFDIIPVGETTLDLPVTIFETTKDSSNLVISTLILQVEFPSEDMARLHYIYQVSNPSLETVIPPDGGEPVLEYKLPPNAINFSFEQQINGDNFIATSGGFGDTRSILAGSETYTLAFGFDLPYKRDLSLDLDLGWPVDRFVVLLPLGRLQLESDFIVKVDETQLGAEQYQVFSGNTIPSGNLLLEITGRNPNAPGGFLGLEINVELVVSISVLLVALAAAFLWFNGTRVGKSELAAETSEDIMDTIITLDEQFESGSIVEDTYQQRRHALKSRLREFLKKAEK